MSKKVRTARGQLIDFDLLKIKNNIASQPAPNSVQTRERFINEKLQRRRAAMIDKNEQTQPEAKQQQYEAHVETQKMPRKINKPKDSTNDTSTNTTDSETDT